MSIFLFIPGITGESKDANHAGWIDIEEYSTGTDRSITHIRQHAATANQPTPLLKTLN